MCELVCSAVLPCIQVVSMQARPRRHSHGPSPPAAHPAQHQRWHELAVCASRQQREGALPLLNLSHRIQRRIAAGEAGSRARKRISAPTAAAPELVLALRGATHHIALHAQHRPAGRQAGTRKRCTTHPCLAHLMSAVSLRQPYAEKVSVRCTRSPNAACSGAAAGT